MIGEAGTQGSISELANYLSYGDKQNNNRVEDRSKRVGWESGRNFGLTSDIDEATDRMKGIAAAKSGEIKDEAYHIILSWQSGNEEEGIPPDNPSREEMEKSIDQVLEELGLEGYQAWVVEHIDTDTPHLHAMVNRVHPRSKDVWRQEYDKTIIYNTIRELEEEHGWHRPAPMTMEERHRLDKPKSPDYWEVEVGEKSVRAWAQQDGLREDLSNATSWTEAERVAEEHGAELVPTENQPAPDGGMVLKKDGTHVAMSSIDPGLSRPKLEERFGQSWTEYQRADEPHEPKSHESRAPRKPAYNQRGQETGAGLEEDSLEKSSSEEAPSEESFSEKSPSGESSSEEEDFPLERPPGEKPLEEVSTKELQDRRAELRRAVHASRKSLRASWEEPGGRSGVPPGARHMAEDALEKEEEKLAETTEELQRRAGVPGQMSRSELLSERRSLREEQSQLEEKQREDEEKHGDREHRPDPGVPGRLRARLSEIQSRLQEVGSELRERPAAVEEEVLSSLEAALKETAPEEAAPEEATPEETERSARAGKVARHRALDRAQRKYEDLSPAEQEHLRTRLEEATGRAEGLGRALDQLNQALDQDRMTVAQAKVIDRARELAARKGLVDTGLPRLDDRGGEELMRETEKLYKSFSQKRQEEMLQAMPAPERKALKSEIRTQEQDPQEQEGSTPQSTGNGANRDSSESGSRSGRSRSWR